MVAISTALSSASEGPGDGLAGAGERTHLAADERSLVDFRRLDRAGAVQRELGDRRAPGGAGDRAWRDAVHDGHGFRAVLGIRVEVGEPGGVSWGAESLLRQARALAVS